MSVGMKAYARELSVRLPRVAPDLSFVAFTGGANFSFEEQIALPLAMRRAKPDLVHLLSLYGPLATPRPYAVTVHDLIHLRFPQFFKAKVGPYYATVVRALCARAARVIVDDERTIADLQRFLHVDARKVRVIPLGVDDRYLAPVTPFAAPRPYVLYAGNHRAHKDLPALFEAWSGLERHVDLYLTGPDDVPELVARYTRPGRSVVTLGDVDEAALAAYYAGAAAYAHPALCEGFGLPMLEAMAARAPVIACSDALPGVLDGAALTFAPRDAAGLRAGLENLLVDEGLRDRLVNEGRKRAEALTWDVCARETANVYREALEEKTR